jgi:hypothetical protein
VAGKLNGPESPSYQLTSVQSARKYPDWGKMRFQHFPAQAWTDILPHASNAAIEFVRETVCFESTRRLSAEKVSTSSLNDVSIPDRGRLCNVQPCLIGDSSARIRDVVLPQGCLPVLVPSALPAKGRVPAFKEISGESGGTSEND